MAFHGGRGNSRGHGPSPGGFRGRGSVRGGARGGRGGNSRVRGRGKPVFDSARIAQKEAEKEEESESFSSSEEELDEFETSEEEDEETVPTVSPYEALLQSFASETSRESKRRKIEHPRESGVIKNEEQDNELENQDAVDEAEEGPETAIEDALDEDEEDSSDPFGSHFADPEDNDLTRRLKAIQNNQWSTQRVTFPHLGNAILRIPQSGGSEVTNFPSISKPAELKLKQKLAVVATEQRSSFDILEQTIAPLIFNYQDVLYCERSLNNQDNLRRLASLHAVNHVFKTRDRVIKDNARLAKEDKDDDIDFKDQGFTRPKVLMILPTRESCVRMVNMITSLCEPEQQENRKRFDDSYVEKEDKFSTEKAEDFRDLFAGNDDDYFRLGLKFTRKTVKYFSQFYNSDIILASPLGLRMVIEGENGKMGDYDFLSSIEMVIVDQADALLMQNWEHVEYIFENLNRRPTEPHGCDFSRVRTWYLEENAKYFRQTITFAAFNTPDINSLLFNRSENWAGKIKINPIYSGVIHQHILGVRAKQTFSRFSSDAMVTDPEDRFAYFKQAIIPGLNRRTKDTAGTVVFIPSYFDFVRVRNYFIEESKLTFGSISEHSSVKEVARARSHFFSGRYSVLLYTERAHHFRRYQLRGVRKVVMYGLPDNSIFYKEIVGAYLSRSVREGKLGREEGSVRVMFSQWDRMKLERIAGTERVSKMITGKGDTFDFV